MKGAFNKIVKRYLRYRYKRIEEIRNNPTDIQSAVLNDLLAQSSSSEVYKKYSFSAVTSRADFSRTLPIVDYEDIKKDIERMMDGEENVLCNGKVTAFAKSSGTTSDRSKYIPMPEQMHFGNHVAATWDTMSVLYHEDPEAEIFKKKSLVMGGSLSEHEGYTIGDVSALLLNKMPWPGRPFFTPDFETALLNDWEEKIDKMSKICIDEPIVMIGGVPTWTLVLCNRLMEMKGASNMYEVWPEMKYYMHGGVGFDPYREQFAKLFPGNKLKYYEIYNASEGYFAAQDHLNSDGMLLLLNNQIYYEFLPLEELESDNPQTLLLEEIELGKSYALVITTRSGLWRYLPGDTVEFTSKAPYRLRVSGRTKQFINAFGEEVMVANTDKAVANTIEQFQCSVKEYTVAPLYMEGKNKGGHTWLVEFDKRPTVSMDTFAQKLDDNLRALNSDYDAKRSHDLALEQLQLIEVPTGTFHNWLKQKGKYGGQHKVPRLSNTRKYVDEILKFMENGDYK